MNDDLPVERPASTLHTIARVVLALVVVIAVVGILIVLSIVVDNPGVFYHQERPQNPTDGTVAEGEVIIMPVPFHHKKK